MSSPEDAYQQLAQVFASRGNQVLEFHIIPSSLGSFLQDENAIGTSKDFIVAAYTVARQLFNRHQHDDLAEATGITEIMLMFDCEHLTACNWRKRHLSAIIETPSPNQELLQAELTLMSSYQCSPLRRHTKSPTLWHHRLWVISHLLRMDTWSPQDLLSLQSSELETVLQAGELHPKNYYAFSYMRQLSVLLDDLGWHWTESAIERLVKWCLSHPRDVSGWSFALYALGLSNSQLQLQALEKVTRYALLVEWTGESIWAFIAGGARQFGLDEKLEELMIPTRETVSNGASTLPGEQREWQAWLGLARESWSRDGLRV